MRLLMNLRTLVGLLLIISLATIAVAIGRYSANYNILFDAVTTGGSTMDSTSFTMADSAVGQSLPVGYSASTLYRNEAGVVVPWGIQSAIDDWEHY